MKRGFYWVYMDNRGVTSNDWTVGEYYPEYDEWFILGYERGSTPNHVGEEIPPHDINPPETRNPSARVRRKASDR